MAKERFTRIVLIQGTYYLLHGDDAEVLAENAGISFRAEGLTVFVPYTNIQKIEMMLDDD